METPLTVPAGYEILTPEVAKMKPEGMKVQPKEHPNHPWENWQDAIPLDAETFSTFTFSAPLGTTSLATGEGQTPRTGNTARFILNMKRSAGVAQERMEAEIKIGRIDAIAYQKGYADALSAALRDANELEIENVEAQLMQRWNQLDIQNSEKAERIRALERELTAATRRAEEAEEEVQELLSARNQLARHCGCEGKQDHVTISLKFDELCSALRQVQAERDEANAKLDTILTDPDYVGGVPYWVAKHTDLAIKNLELATALAGAEKWQPIESAPKDGSQRIIIAQFRGNELVDLDFDAVLEPESESWEMPQVYYVWKSAHGRVEEPTHWMLLPAFHANEASI